MMRCCCVIVIVMMMGCGKAPGLPPDSSLLKPGQVVRVVVGEHEHPYFHAADEETAPPEAIVALKGIVHMEPGTTVEIVDDDGDDRGAMPGARYIEVIPMDGVANGIKGRMQRWHLRPMPK